MNGKPKLIAYYLPQYHPIPENDEWWQKGFTEWTNVSKARPLFKGHYQPRYPADLGYYDLRVPEIRAEQARLASENGVYGFCYYHYWFGNGKQLLERPLNEVLASGKPNFPFMLCWANQTWKGVWFGASTGKTLIEQLYPGVRDYEMHFKYLMEAFQDPRYIRINGLPVFQVYMPREIPDLRLFTETFRRLAHQMGFSGIYLLASNCPDDWNPQEFGFDGVISNNFARMRYYGSPRIIKDKNSLIGKVEGYIRRLLGERPVEQRTKPFLLDFKKFSDLLCNWQEKEFDYYPMIVPDWDNSARAGKRSFILKNSTPKLWGNQITAAVKYVNSRDNDKRLVFVKSWNEWAEGNYLEPDSYWGDQYLKQIQLVLNQC